MNVRKYLINFFYLGLFALIVIGCKDHGDRHDQNGEPPANGEEVEEVEVIDVEEDQNS